MREWNGEMQFNKGAMAAPSCLLPSLLRLLVDVPQLPVYVLSILLFPLIAFKLPTNKNSTVKNLLGIFGVRVVNGEFSLIQKAGVFRRHSAQGNIGPVTIRVTLQDNKRKILCNSNFCLQNDLCNLFSLTIAYNHAAIYLYTLCTYIYM